VKLLIIAILLLTPIIGQSVTVYKCKDENGKTVFSQQPCGDAVEEMNVTNPRGGLGKPQSNKTAQQQLRDLQKLRDKPRRTGRKKRSRCAHIQSVTRRNMIVKRQLFKCMTKAEVRKVLGSPHSRHTGSRGNRDESWHYHYMGGASTHIFFDDDGLVKSWSGRR